MASVCDELQPQLQILGTTGLYLTEGRQEIGQKEGRRHAAEGPQDEVWALDGCTEQLQPERVSVSAAFHCES